MIFLICHRKVATSLVDAAATVVVLILFFTLKLFHCIQLITVVLYINPFICDGIR